MLGIKSRHLRRVGMRCIDGLDKVGESLLNIRGERVIIVGWCIVHVVTFVWDTGGEGNSCGIETHVGHSVLEISGKSVSRHNIGGIQ